MTVIDLLTIPLALLPFTHEMIRRTQDRQTWVHLPLMAVSLALAVAYAGGWSAWVTVPALVALAVASQVMFTRDGRRSPARGTW